MKDLVRIVDWELRLDPFGHDVVVLNPLWGHLLHVRINSQESSLLERGAHPSYMWRVRSWEPRWSVDSRVEIRSGSDGRVFASVVSDGQDITSVARVPISVGLLLARHAFPDLTVQRDLVASTNPMYIADDLSDEVAEFNAFIERAPGFPPVDHRELAHV